MKTSVVPEGTQGNSFAFPGLTSGAILLRRLRDSGSPGAYAIPTLLLSPSGVLPLYESACPSETLLVWNRSVRLRIRGFRGIEFWGQKSLAEVRYQSYWCGNPIALTIYVNAKFVAVSP